MTVQINCYTPGVLFETIECPDAWNDRVERIAATGATVYGPNWRPEVVELLLKVSAGCRDGMSASAYDSLVRAESKLGLLVPVP